MFGFSKPDVPTIEVEKVKKAVDNKEDIVILDVRTRPEFEKGALPEAINIPLSELESVITQKIPDKNKTIYAYCLSGSRSIQAVHMLQNMGYENAYSVISGILSWRNKGYQVC